MKDIVNYGICYQKFTLSTNEYLLFPLRLVVGTKKIDCFQGEKSYPYLTHENLSKHEILIGKIVTNEELAAKYGQDDDLSDEFLAEYYFSELKENLLYITITDSKTLTKHIDVNLFRNKDMQATFQIVNDKPSVLLNENLVNQILSIPDIENLKATFLQYKQLIASFEEKNKEYGTTRILVKNGQIQEMEDNGSIKIGKIKRNTSHHYQKNIIENKNNSSAEFSLLGLETYLKERIIGHDDEIEDIATIMMNNIRATTTSRDTESILLVGPTGTGKTATFRAISEYFQIPFREINTPNLVPEGIVGTNIEDILRSIISECNGDINTAQKAILLFDEFDKLAKSGLNVKEDVVQTLYKFIEGAPFHFDYESHNVCYDTGKPTKIYTGVFNDAYITTKSAGFEQNLEKTCSFSFEKLYQDSIFNKELLDRISHKIYFQKLSREDQKKIILYSKLSKLNKKKEMFKREYQIDLVTQESYIDALLDNLSNQNNSVRDINNLISSSLIKAQREIMLNEGSYQRLTLTADTIKNPKKFNLE